MRSVQGIVLAGSYYWGEGAFERLLRGPLLPVAQRPIITFPLAWLRAGAVESATVCANSSTPMVEGALGDGAALGMTLSYYADAQPRGPAGCARDAAALNPAETYVIVEGAMVPSLDLGELLAAHWRAGAAATTVVEVDRRRAAVGTPRRGAPGGIYVFERHVLEGVPAAGFQDIKQGLLERLYAAGARVHVHEMRGLSPRILDYASYAAVSGWLIATAARRPDFRDYVPVGDGLRHPTATVDPSARLIGPVIVGPGASVGPDAVLVGPTSIGAHSAVEAGAVVSRSSVWDQCCVGVGAVVDASLLAHAVVIAPGERLMSAVEVVDSAPIADLPASPPHPAPDPEEVRVPSDFSLFPGMLAPGRTTG
ncbi:mannose-1-phosphate guanylyltransferase [Gemmatimonadetes bacterium T265]|nr:mannose-1-phosphate guanylyltransferase [Gemmatimonadetes bacterium T265]